MSDLVSVGVATFNSARWVEETLDSVRLQTHRNIELIISDDGSTDNTAEVCAQWVGLHGHRFERVEWISVSENTGVSANCNRIIRASRADWIKFIAGDDILLPNCIADNLQFVQSRPDAIVVFSQVDVFRNEFTPGSFVRRIPACFPNNLMHPDFSAEHQYRLLLLSDRVNYTPSYFFHRSAIEAVGGYDEGNRWVEDYPMWLKLTQRGFRLHFFEKPTVGYRQHEGAVNNRLSAALVNPAQMRVYSFRKEYVHALLPWDIAWKEKFTMLVGVCFDMAGLNRDTPLLRALFRLLSIYMNPFEYIGFIKKKLGAIDPIFYGLK